MVEHRWPSLLDRWSTFNPNSTISVCCLMFKDGHPARIHELLKWLCENPPLVNALPSAPTRRLSNLDATPARVAGVKRKLIPETPSRQTRE